MFCLVDLKKAYDSVPRDKLFDELRKEAAKSDKQEQAEHLVEVLVEMYTNHVIVFEDNDGKRTEFKTTTGVI